MSLRSLARHSLDPCVLVSSVTVCWSVWWTVVTSEVPGHSRPSNKWVKRELSVLLSGRKPGGSGGPRGSGPWLSTMSLVRGLEEDPCESSSGKAGLRSSTCSAEAEEAAALVCRGSLLVTSRPPGYNTELTSLSLASLHHGPAPHLGKAPPPHCGSQEGVQLPRRAPCS